MEEIVKLDSVATYNTMRGVKTLHPLVTLLDLSKSVSQVAYDLGFKYPQHFTRLFKQRVGCTPVEYRLLN